MAEGVHVALSDSQYLCHGCNMEVSIRCMEELICPSCSSEFVEELPQEEENDDELDIYADLDRIDGINSVDEEIPFVTELGMNGIISQMLMNVRTNIVDVDASANIDEEDEDDEDEDDEEIGIDDLRNMHMIGSTMRFLNIEGLSEDLDLLASQLLDEIDLAGPGPLTPEQIKQLKTVAISQEQVASGLQCTVCMEDFVLNEETKSLNCNHIYHEKCLVPWLERQATCPNCRKTVEIPVPRRSQSCPRSSQRAENEPQTRSSGSASSSPRDFISQRERYRHIFL